MLGDIDLSSGKRRHECLVRTWEPRQPTKTPVRSALPGRHEIRYGTYAQANDGRELLEANLDKYVVLHRM